MCLEVFFYNILIFSLSLVVSYTKPCPCIFPIENVSIDRASDTIPKKNTHQHMQIHLKYHLQAISVILYVCTEPNHFVGFIFHYGPYALIVFSSMPTQNQYNETTTRKRQIWKNATTTQREEINVVLWNLWIFR